MAVSGPTRAQMIVEVESALRAALPRGWGLDVVSEAGRAADFVVTLTAPDGQQVIFVAEMKREATRPSLRTALDQLQQHRALAPDARPLLVVPWISERSKERLAADDISYVDATGNIRLTAERPGLLLTALGASRNPWPAEKSLQSLRGSGAARAVRALLDVPPPYGLRELARRTDVSISTLSRVIGLLDREGLVERDERGAVLDLDRVGTIRRWADDYDVLRTNNAVGYLQPRGLTAVTQALTEVDLRYALTGSLAANMLAPLAPARLAQIYVDDPRRAVAALDLRATDAGANVMLLDPFDDVVFTRGVERDGLTLVNPTQLAVDLLTGPGRAPAEAEELLASMEGDAGGWRA